MIKVDLITGFLGAGKTTFLRKYVKYFTDRGQKVGVLENDYGAVNVDMLLLNDIRSENCELEMVAGGCDADCHRRRFKTKLIAMGMSGYDRVVIEPSGVFDVDEFFDALHEDPLECWYETGNVIAIVDARLADDLSQISDYYLASQIAHAGRIVLSRTQLTDREHIERTIEHLNRAAQSVALKLPIRLLVRDKNWDDMDEEDMRELASCEYRGASYVKKYSLDESCYNTVYFLEVPMNTDKIRRVSDNLFSDAGTYGRVHRIKGFYKENATWYEVNATKNEIEISGIPVGQEVLIVIGEELKDAQIRNLIEGQ